MEHIYAPWRYNYVTDEKVKGCVFCHISENLEDEKLQVIFSDEYCYVVMNKFPYSPGHIMVIPYFHTCNVEDLDETIWLKMSIRVQQAVKLLKEVMPCEGVNIGMNLGKAAGAGIEQHIHYHLVPRWIGDTNFITTIAQTRVYPASFEEIYKKLKDNTKKYFF
ncbi:MULTISPECIES: HIT family protein [Aliarcobacter]|jgi:ATP adenylyltransferase|uniref:HIT domain-containing protein n=5 Tax=Arcobacteraceae TaxID=2808963 RepID=A0AA96DUS3_9BACT|nr:HIT domain-containing protein [Aliarcobacter cryaerophilus]NCB11479.1 HIT domain-containing protein [Erysipelotrichia bacterium]OQA76385.1 MAG: AP-4-A phosphorylase [Candidatus Dependentiae bacterium ADurb.Bin246]WNL28412.1 HIT domain-containing protein [Arcobacter sp. AZ-2023]WPD06493.1 HIT domain-containing protein [Arcobacter sp. DSM 115956]WPD08584.1 HIT domain-containing protein [Arcobacter sp. DSM 115955]WPD11534.1 HIT domain-containing protein [Arcobacter sp. DSM 115960]